MPTFDPIFKLIPVNTILILTYFVSYFLMLYTILHDDLIGNLVQNVRMPMVQLGKT